MGLVFTESNKRTPPHRGPVAVWNEREKSRLGRSQCALALASRFWPDKEN
jgi:hypothetical protein